LPPNRLVRRIGAQMWQLGNSHVPQKLPRYCLPAVVWNFGDTP